MKTLILTGPESTGKSSLANALAQKYHCSFVPEYARRYLEENGLQYSYDDLYQIALGQQKQELAYAKKTSEYLILDTSFLVLKIWSKYRFGKVHPFIEETFQAQSGLYLLCGTDVPWQADPQREHPQERAILYALYLDTLIKYEKEFLELSGNIATRIELVKSYLTD